MGYDYALVHVKYTVPPAIALTYLHRPLRTTFDLYKTAWLICIAVASTIPWDSYLIRRRIWTYPPDAVLGPVAFSIPVEELFFFVIQTYTTSLLYILINKPVLHARYLFGADEGHSDRRRASRGALGPRTVRVTGQVVLAFVIGAAAVAVYDGGRATYTGLILAWVAPFMLLLWSLAHPFLVALPAWRTVVPIALPTVYLWVVDTLALKRGTWAIESGTKLGLHLWPGLDVEEALFFLVTNTVIVLGLTAFDYSMTVLEAFPAAFATVPDMPSPALLMKALMLPRSRYARPRIAGIVQASKRLQKKSRSFHLASSTFQGRLRIDLVLLYSFCRVADDLVDNASSVDEANGRVADLRAFLDAAYSDQDPAVRSARLAELIDSRFTAETSAALHSLPTAHLSPTPLYQLLEGFEMDLLFDADARAGKAETRWPVLGEDDLELYSLRVAGTVAELCLDLVFHHAPEQYSSDRRKRLTLAGRNMGIALQLVNIARDIAVDARMRRVYLPRRWLEQVGLTPEDVLKQPHGSKIDLLRHRLLSKAHAIYGDARSAIDELPRNGRQGMRVAVESYMEIGRVLQEDSSSARPKEGQASVPGLRRLRVAWRALTR